jgi:predicted HicB family RNase H-like nuclease
MATVYLRDFPEDLHRIVKAEAALEGITLKAIIIKALEEYLKKQFYQSKWKVSKKKE